MLQKDHDYWKQFIGELVGEWITDETSVKEICDFNDNTYRRKNLRNFKGDPAFAKDKKAQTCFSKLRSSIAGLYAWRMTVEKNQQEQEQLREAADLAYRQALACNPSSPEVVFHYAKFLTNLKRSDEAILMVETAQRIEPENPQFSDLLNSLHKAF